MGNETTATMGKRNALPTPMPAEAWHSRETASLFSACKSCLEERKHIIEQREEAKAVMADASKHKLNELKEAMVISQTADLQINALEKKARSIFDDALNHVLVDLSAERERLGAATNAIRDRLIDALTELGIDPRDARRIPSMFPSADLSAAMAAYRKLDPTPFFTHRRENGKAIEVLEALAAQQ